MLYCTIIFNSDICSPFVVKCNEILTDMNNWMHFILDCER
jgi:hypothetical protein